MENGANKLELSPALVAIREKLRKPDQNTLPAMRNDWNGLREFLIGGIREDGMWPAGTISIRHDQGDLCICLSIHSLEIEARYRFDSWDSAWETLDHALTTNSIGWQLDYKGRERLSKKIALS